MQISFNKGKDFYSIGNEASVSDILFILNKLNTKAWNNITSNMEDKVIELFGVYPCPDFSINKQDKDFEEVEPERFKRYDILNRYLYYYGLYHKTDKFIV